MSKNNKMIDLFDRIMQQERDALDFGFYWESLDQLLDQIRSECNEIKEAWIKGDQGHLKEEVGDLMNATVSLAIFLKLNPEDVLSDNVGKFQKRYDKLVKLVAIDGLKDLKDQPMHVLLSYWDRAKT
jgi:uncharacterized protein YabN with tetrapyrrole methylase and pyrophosphatase domain